MKYEITKEKELNEKWKRVNYPGLEHYMISNYGRMIGPTGIFLNYYITNSGYYNINLYNRELNCQKHYAPHILEARTFIPLVEGKEIVNHIDGNKLNLDSTNLEWCTHSENLAHAHRTGLRNQDGTRNHNAKHSEEQVRNVCELIEAGYSNTEIIEKVFGYKPLPIRKDKRSCRDSFFVQEIRRRTKWKSISKDYNW